MEEEPEDDVDVDHKEIVEQLRNAQLRQIQVFVAISESRLHQINYGVLPSKITFCESVFDFFNTDDPNLQ